MKIAVVTPIPTPYRDPFWNVVSEQPGVDLTVYYCAAGKSDRPWSGDWERNYCWEVLSGRNLLAWQGTDAAAYYNPSIARRLQDEMYDAVLIGGYNHPTMLAAIRQCIKQGTPYFLMCESHLQKYRGALKRLLKDRLVRWVVGNMAGGFPTGTLAERYLLHYGARAETLTHLPNAPDVEAIRTQARALRKNRDMVRKELGFSERPTLLFAGRLIPKKGAHIILEALALIDPARRPDLVIVGDGPERPPLKNLASRKGLTGRVWFAGFVEPADMVKWYVAADMFVLPSAETWGVVVPEALAAGTAVIVADQVGCHPDIVGKYPVGRVLPRGAVNAWRLAITDLATAPIKANTIEQVWSGCFESMRYEFIASSMLTNMHACAGHTEPTGRGIAE